MNCGWELSLAEAGKWFPSYQNRNGMEGLRIWISEMRKRWPDAKCITMGEFGMLWRRHFKHNDAINDQFQHRGSGIRGSIADLEIRWFMNQDFRLALQRDWKKGTPAMVIDYTRYDLPASEPADPQPGSASRNWSLMNRLNQKGARPQDQPAPITSLPADDQHMIRSHYPELFDTPPEAP